MTPKVDLRRSEGGHLTPKVDFKQFAPEIETLFRSAIPKEDLQALLDKIAGDYLEASSLGRHDLLEQLQDQLKAVGEVQRIRLNDGQWKALDAILKLAAKAVVAGVKAAL